MSISCQQENILCRSHLQFSSAECKYIYLTAILQSTWPYQAKADVFADLAAEL